MTSITSPLLKSDLQIQVEEDYWMIMKVACFIVMEFDLFGTGGSFFPPFSFNFS